jgi:hypothetical protein
MHGIDSMKRGMYRTIQSTESSPMIHSTSSIFDTEITMSLFPEPNVARLKLFPNQNNKTSILWGEPGPQPPAVTFFLF